MTPIKTLSDNYKSSKYAGYVSFRRFAVCQLVIDSNDHWSGTSIRDAQGIAEEFCYVSPKYGTDLARSMVLAFSMYDEPCDEERLNRLVDAVRALDEHIAGR